jgi:hypothetical protein
MPSVDIVRQSFAFFPSWPLARLMVSLSGTGQEGSRGRNVVRSLPAFGAAGSRWHGEVWRAYDTATDRIVAIKVLPEHFSNDPGFQQRFRREAHPAARLNSPHVIPIHNYGEIMVACTSICV